MSLAIGSNTGPYEIAAPLGASGMREVYRARAANWNERSRCWLNFAHKAGSAWRAKLIKRTRPTQP